MNYFVKIFLLDLLLIAACCAADQARTMENFNRDWKFHLGDVTGAEKNNYDDSGWRRLDLPHDWSIEGEFSSTNPSTPGGGALPGGIGWYRKSFTMPDEMKDKLSFIEFDGVYRNSEVWINGNYLGKRPYGYSSFRYELTPYLEYGNTANIISVKVDNSRQPNSRWYSGSGIYRNVRLVANNRIYVDHWGTFITTVSADLNKARVQVNTKIINNYNEDKKILLRTVIVDKYKNRVAESVSEKIIRKNSSEEVIQILNINNPELWSLENPYLYSALTTVETADSISDDYRTDFGIRTFHFDSKKGFFLNGENIKIKGVCNHHDLGCLGAAVNKRAIERQLEIMKEMGVNGIRTSHNPPAPELLDLCDRMGFIVMDEAFDVWKKKKTEYDYALDWEEWHQRDLQDLILRDRNHPSVFIWSIGNEVIEQWDKKDTTGIFITKELAEIVRDLDSTRLITAGCNDTDPENPLIKSGALDIIGYNYAHQKYSGVPDKHPGSMFIASETTSALATRGVYDMPSDTIRIWPYKWDEVFTGGNPDNTCSAYDNCHVPWGSTHRDTWMVVREHDFVSGMFIWTGFDYLGEPTPYTWPSRSSYFGIVDLAGFPKDAFYFYKSEWTDKPMLHLFPHWNWSIGDTIDVWTYTNCEEVELFLNGNSAGLKKRNRNNLYLMWRLPYQPGSIKAVGKSKGAENLVKEIRTAGIPDRILLEADRNTIAADGADLSFITVKVLDKDGNIVPDADNLINFELKGEGKIAGVDNGLQTSHEPFKANYRKAFKGMCLVVIKSEESPGEIVLEAESENLQGSAIKIISN